MDQSSTLGVSVFIAALFVWVVSVVRVVGTFVYREPFGAEATLALVMIVLMTRVLVAPARRFAARWVSSRQRS